MQFTSNSSVRRWFLTAVRQYPLQAAAVVILSVLSSIADGLSISLLIPFLTLLFDTTDAGVLDAPYSRALLRAARLAGHGNEVVAISAVIMALIVFRCAVAFTEAQLSNWTSGKISCAIRSQIHRNLLDVNYEYVSLTDNGRLLNTLDGETWSATEAITTYFGLITSVCMALVLSGLLLLISWKLTLVVALLVGCVSLVMLLFHRRMRGISAASVIASENLSERAVELFDAMRMTRAYGREPRAQAAYDTASQRLFEVSMRGVRANAAVAGVQEVLYAVTFVIVIFAALRLGLAGPTLIAFLALLHRLQPHVRSIDGARLHLASLSASVSAVSTLLALEPWSPPKATSPAPARLSGTIRFDQVSFAYSGKDRESRKALDDVSLELPIGKVTAIVGWSGAGKSTLINLLFRFHDPDSGTLTLDGKPLADLDLRWWRSQLAIAGQDAELIGGTIRENIEYGLEGATFDDVVSAAKHASVHDFIVSLPHGYDTRIGGRGALLSGGQRQRIGLARALVRRSGILILDEATNSLDSMTEAEILESLERLRSEMTIVVVAHRLSTTRGADRVIALAGGRVVESGTPDELLNGRGLYAQMVQLQELARRRGEPVTAAESVLG